MNNFTDIISLIKNSIQTLIDFINMLLPILVSLMIATGNVVFANIIQPILLFLITFIGNLVITVIIPFLLAATVLSIVSKISDRVQLDKLSKLFKSSIIWVLTLVLTLFAGIVSLEGSLSNKVDEVTTKTAKAAVSNLIPVVGKILGDTIDTVIGCGGILKNAVGTVGIIVIIGICIKPIVKLLIFMLLYYLLSAIAQPIADKKIIGLLEQIGDTFKVLLAILCSISMMLIIGITLIIKASSVG